MMSRLRMKSWIRPPYCSTAVSREGMDMKCTVFDHNGNVRTVSGAFKKVDLCEQHGLQPRDLRKIDTKVPNAMPTILVRREAIIVNVLHIRALIKAEEVWLFDSVGSVDSVLHSKFVYALEGNLKTASITFGNLPYEMR